MKQNREQFTLIQQLVQLDEQLGCYRDKGNKGFGLNDIELALVGASAEYSLVVGNNVVNRDFIPADYSKVKDLKNVLGNSGVSRHRITGLREKGRNLSYKIVEGSK